MTCQHVSCDPEPYRRLGKRWIGEHITWLLQLSRSEVRPNLIANNLANIAPEVEFETFSYDAGLIQQTFQLLQVSERLLFLCTIEHLIREWNPLAKCCNDRTKRQSYYYYFSLLIEGLYLESHWSARSVWRDGSRKEEEKEEKREEGINVVLDIVKDSYSFLNMTRDVSTSGISLLCDEIAKILRWLW
jgi:hypothetical protein